MKKFFTDNFDALFKFVKTHFVMSLLGIMVGLPVISFESSLYGAEDGSITVIAIVASVFTIGFMCFMHYDDMYFIGAKNAISEKGAGKKPDALRGVKITFLAYSPVILIGIITSILSLVPLQSDKPTFISLLVFYVVQGSFIPLYALRFYIGVWGYVLVSLLPAIAASVLGYAIGRREKTLRGMLGFKVKPPYDGPVERKNRWFRK